MLLIVVISLVGKDTNTTENLKLVWDSPLTPLRIPGHPGIMNYNFLSIVVLGAACALYYVFRSPSEERVNAWKAANPEAAAKVEAHIHPVTETEVQ